jgi:DNA polymerase-1
MNDTKLCLIDANSLFYRAYFAIRAELVTSSGQPTNAVFGFVKMVNKIVEELQPQYLAVCFDVGKRTYRTEKFSAYKIHRPSMPETLLSQVPWIKEVVRGYRFAIFEKEGFEADDVIATLTHRLKKKVGKVVVISSDKDILQLVGENVEVYNPYKEDGIVFTKEVVKEKLGVEPARIRDLISLAGDASDNIPGAKGIGEKTAKALLSEFKDVDELTKNKNRIKRESLRKIIEENLDLIRLSRDLAVLREDVPLDFDLEDLKVQAPDTDKLWDLFSRLEFKGMLKALSEERLSVCPGPSLEIPKKRVTDTTELLARARRQKQFAFFINQDDASGEVLKMNIALDAEVVYEIGELDFLKELFSCADSVAISHDVKQAKHILRKAGIEPKTKFFDTMIAAYLLQSSKAATALESLLWDHLSLKTVSRLDYLGKESHFLFRLQAVLTAGLKEKELLRLFDDVETPLIDALFEMESAGIAIDVRALKTLSHELEKKLEKLVVAIYGLADCQFNINSPKQLSEVLFNKLKLPVVKKTKTGLSTDEEVLTRLSQEYELPKVLLEYRQLTKLKTTYIDALPELVSGKTGRIHSNFNQTGTETGRLSSSNPNLQNIPVKTELGRSIRQAFIPSDEFDALLSADYSQIELRILAHLSQDEVLIKAFQRDLDIHTYTASLIFGAEEKDVTARMRENAKRVNFGIVYGMSAYGLAKDLGIDPKTAEVFITEYFLRYPKVKAYLDSQIDFVKKNGYAVTLLGRRRYIPEINNANVSIRQFSERQAVNAPIQGSAADLIKLAMVEAHHRLKKEGFRSRLVLQVHDELVFEIKKKEEKELIKLVYACMEKVMTLRVPVKVTMRLGKNWLDAEEIK